MGASWDVVSAIGFRKTDVITLVLKKGYRNSVFVGANGLRRMLSGRHN